MKVFVTVLNGVAVLVEAEKIDTTGDATTWGIDASNISQNTAGILEISTASGWTWYLPGGTWLSCLIQTNPEDD